MKIQNHLLENVKFIKSPNFHPEINLKNPKYLIMHFTGSTTLQSTVNTFLDKESDVSCHIIIDRNGDVIQMIPFDKIAWHCGISSWKKDKWINNYSIGIEFVNTGKLQRNIDYYTDYYKHKFYDMNDIYFDGKEYWQKFPDIQIEKGIEIAKLLVKEYKLIDILGHSDIAPGRKSDPGKAFPMEKFKELEEPVEE